MKKILAAFIIGVTTLSANVPVFSQKVRNVRTKRPVAQTFAEKANVKLKGAAAYSDGNGVYLAWESAFETANLGFNVYRLGAQGYEPASRSLIFGGSLRSSEAVVQGEKYSFFDVDGNENSSYYVESFGTDGARQKLVEVNAVFLKDLTKVAGASSDEMRQSVLNAKPSIEQAEADLPADLKGQINTSTLPPDINKQRWLAGQSAVKIGVKQDGLYRVSRAQLQSAGFDVNTPGNLWQLYFNGNEQAIIVGANDAYIEFYGKGMDTIESLTGTYYLIAGAQNGKRINSATVKQQRGSLTANSFRHLFHRKERTSYISSGIINGEKENFFGSQTITPANNPTLTFNLPSIDFNDPKSLIEINLQTITLANHQVRAILNGHALEFLSGFGIIQMTGYFKIPTSFLQEGNNTLQFQALSGTSDISVVESIKINYPRKYQANLNKLTFYTLDSQATNVTGFATSDIRVFDLTAPDSPVLLNNAAISGDAGNYGFSLPASRSRVLYAVTDAALLNVDSLTLNAPSALATTAHNGEMLIVSHKDWLTQAEDWANYRRSQGMTVEVVEATDIYDEFSYGAVSAAGMTSFFNYAKNNWQTPPNYVLLIGDGTYDLKNYENRLFRSYIPTKLVDTFYEETGSDEALCDFNLDGLSEIAIGRIPARSGEEVTLVLNKTMAFEANLSNAWNRGGLLVSDLFNGYNFEEVSRRLGTHLPAGMPKTYIDRSQPNSRTNLLAELNTGKYLVNYAGHGSTGAWDGQFLSVNDISLINNAPNYSLYFMLTCLNGYFIRNDSNTNQRFDSLGEALLRSPNGAAVAAWASTGRTTADVQEIMATRFYQQLSSSNMNRMGDLIRDAKSVISAGRDVRLSWALLGDPALKIKN